MRKYSERIIPTLTTHKLVNEFESEEIKNYLDESYEVFENA